MPRDRNPATQVRRLRFMLRQSAQMLAEIAAEPGSARAPETAAWWIKQIDRELAPRRPPRPKCVWCKTPGLRARHLLERQTNGEGLHLCKRHWRRYLAETNARKLRHA